MNKRKIFDRLAKRFEDSIKVVVTPEEQSKFDTFLCSAFGSESLQSRPQHNEWLYRKNPANTQFKAWNKGQATGCQSALTCTFTYANGAIDGSWAMDLFVREDWRMKGLGVALIKKVIDNNNMVMVLGVSAEAKAMFASMNWKDMGHVNYFIKPLSVLGFSGADQNHQLKGKLLFPLASFAVRALTTLKLLFLPSHKEKKVTDFKKYRDELELLFSIEACCFFKDTS